MEGTIDNNNQTKKVNLIRISDQDEYEQYPENERAIRKIIDVSFYFITLV